MDPRKPSGVHKPVLCLIRLIFLSTSLFLNACGNGTQSTPGTAAQADETAAATFSVHWLEQQAPRSEAASTLSRGLSCSEAGIETVWCDVYDASGILLASGGPWTCSAGSGRVDYIPAGTGRKFIILGLDGNGLVVYRGESAAVAIVSGETANAGTIQAYPFVPQLTAPANGSSGLAPGSLSLTWEAIQKAAEYQVLLSVDGGFRDMQAQPASAPGLVPAGLAHDTVYHWKVFAIDAYGNESAESNEWVFRTAAGANRPPAAQILSPADNSHFDFGTGVALRGSAADPEDGTLSGSALHWRSSINGVLGTGTAITTAALTMGTHTITLEAVDGAGAAGSASILLIISDRSPPSVPQEFAGAVVSEGRVDLAWRASRDNVGVIGYLLMRDGHYLAATASIRWSDVNVRKNTRYCYSVTAYDEAGNYSDVSAQACVLVQEEHRRDPDDDKEDDKEDDEEDDR